MSEWWTYRLSDFLMFSPRSHARLLQAHHAAWWPLQPLVTLVVLVLLARVARRAGEARWLAAVVAIGWAAVAWDFLAQRYADIHLGAVPMAWAFGGQAAGLAFAAVRAPAHAGGKALWPAAVLLIAYPAVTVLLGDATGGPTATAQWVVGFTPDPTAAFTLALLPALWPWRWVLPLALIPLATLAVGTATLHLLQWPALASG